MEGNNENNKINSRERLIWHGKHLSVCQLLKVACCGYMWVTNAFSFNLWLIELCFAVPMHTIVRMYEQSKGAYGILGLDSNTYYLIQQCILSFILL